MYLKDIGNGYLEVIDGKGERQATAYGIYSATVFLQKWFTKLKAQVSNPRTQQRARRGESQWKKQHMVNLTTYEGDKNERYKSEDP